MTDFRQIRKDCIDEYGRSTPTFRAIIALLDRAIAEDANGQRTPVLGIHYNYTDHYVEGLKAEIAALARKLVDERARTKKNHEACCGIGVGSR